MSKAEDLAREIYPDWELTNNPKVDGVEQSEVRIQRAAFVEGYRQAEKDLALTWEDIETIDQIFTDVFKDGFDVITNKYYQEVLNRFNKLKRE